MKRYSQAGTTMVPDCTSLDGKQSGMWVKYEDVEVLLAELNLLRSQVRNSRVPEAATGWTRANHREESLERAIHARPGTQWTFWIMHKDVTYKHVHVLPEFAPPDSGSPQEQPEKQ